MVKTSAGQRQKYQQIFEAPDARVLVVDDNEMNLLVAEKTKTFSRLLAASNNFRKSFINPKSIKKSASSKTILRTDDNFSFPESLALRILPGTPIIKFDLLEKFGLSRRGVNRTGFSANIPSP